MKSSVNGYDQINTPAAECAHRLMDRGRGYLDAKAWRRARGAFSEAQKLAPEVAPAVADCYMAAAQGTKNPKTAVYCGREAKRAYKKLCLARGVPPRMLAGGSLRPGQGMSPTVSPAESPGDTGRMLHALATQYSTLSRLKTYNGHDTRRAITSFSHALEHLDDIDRPAGYRGRLDAATAWLAHHRKDARWWHQGVQRRQRAQAWEDALMLLRIPAWSDASTSTWEGVGDLSGACPDKVSAETVKRRVVPLLQEALCDVPRDRGHGNPWHATAALLTFHPKTMPCLLPAMRRAVAEDRITAARLPAALSCYDRALVTDARQALDAAEDLATLRARFWDEGHAMGNLVFVGGRYMEAAQKHSAHAAGAHVLEALGDVAEHTPAEDAALTAVSMLGYVAKKMPDFGEAAVARLSHLGAAREKSVQVAGPEFARAIVEVLLACCKKPVARPVRAAAAAALNEMGNPGDGHAG